MNKFNVEPCGYYCLIEMLEVEEKTESGIIISVGDEVKRAKMGQSVGRLIAIGPRAFKGLSNGCDSIEDWGLAIGDVVEFTSFEGKIPKAGKNDNLRLIQDQMIIGKVKDNDKL